MNRSLGVIAAMLLAAGAWAQLDGVGNTRSFLYGQSFPVRSAFIEEGQTVTVTTETWPVAPGQRVVAVVTTDNFQTTQEYVFTFDGNANNRSRWYALLGPWPSGSEVKYYLRAEGTGGATRFDNNAGRNFGFYARWTPRYRPGAILQWFATDYRTMMARLPEVVRAGYSAIYLPPPQKSGAGGFSVGFNPFDRFDLGDRLSMGTMRTRYGSTQELRELIAAAKRMGLEVYADLVFNHNDNRASSAISRYPDMLPEDFHIRSSADTGNNEVNFNNESSFTFGMLNHDLVGLTDIATEDGNLTQSGPFNLPNFASFNSFGKPSFVRHPRIPAFYPNNAPTSEDVRQFLKRWGWYLTRNLGFDGYRLDAVKHTNPAFFDLIPDSDQPGGWSSQGDLLPYLYSLNRNLYIFAEDFTSVGYELREYAKTGMNLLDFPFKFRVRSELNGTGFGNLGAFSNGWGLDAATGLAYEYGGLARDNSVAMIQSHDDGPPASNNLAMALMLARPARPLVYYDGNNMNPFDYSQFPRPGRADALGNFGDMVTRLVDARNRFARGFLVNRWVRANLYVFERQVDGNGLLLVGLNLRGDTSQTITVDTAFQPGQVLEDLTGQQPNVTVGADRRVRITVPSNSDANSQNNARGFVYYAPVTPPIEGMTVRGTVEFPFETVTTPAGTHGSAGSYRRAIVRENEVTLDVSAPGAASVWVKLNNGQNIGGRRGPTGTPERLTDGFVALTALGNGQFRLPKTRLNDLVEGLHVFRVRAFADTGNRPGVYREQPFFFEMKRSKGIVLDGQLTEYGPALVNQSRTPSSNVNRLDQLFVTNDEQNLYIGLAGNVDASESLTNGIALFLDVDPLAATGTNQIANYDDDSSPAARLLSHHRVNAPSAFRPDFGLGILRGTPTSMRGDTDPVLAGNTGAWSALFRLNLSNPRLLLPRRAAVAFAPRGGPFDQPARGWEVAIPLSELYAYPSTETRLNLAAFLATTGDSGQTLLSTDTRRAAQGGYGESRAWVSNQFLPPQTSVTTDPGTAAVQMSQAIGYVLRVGQPLSSVSFQASTPVFDAGNRQWEQTVTVTNTGGATTSPLFLVITPPVGVTVENAAGRSFRGNLPYVPLSASGLRAGQTATVKLWYAARTGGFTPSFAVFRGPGVF